jgi:hypothetical protein
VPSYRAADIYYQDWAKFNVQFPGNSWTLPFPTGDANMDGTVGIADLGFLVGHYGGLGSWIDGDFNFDGIVNVDDLGILSSSLGESYGQLPEPASLALLALLLPMVFRHRRTPR